MNRGFTVIEVLVTLVVIGILLGLGTVGIRSSLANARDAERKADIETIARGLEQRYNRGSSYDWMEDTNSDGVKDTLRTTTWSANTYPGNNELWETFFWEGRARREQILPGVNDAAWKSPSGENTDAACFFWFFGSEQPRCDAAEKPTTIQGYFSNGSGGWRDRYVYEFIGANGGYCNINDCTRYNLYWISETAPTNAPSMGIPGLQVWRSKHE
jgi:prepilin-type N-terminal cleavage/methylation domain-containing protein